MQEQSDRRESKPFEPPPWERDQFEELKRQREEQQAEDELAAALTGLGQPPRKRADAALTDQEGADDGEVGQAEPDDGDGEQEGSRPEAKAKELPEGFEAMMARLAFEEPREGQGMWKIGLVGAAILGFIGMPLTVWGVFGLIRSAQADGEPVAAMGGAIMVLFGLGFVGLAAYMAMRNLRQGGVL
jgi:hypothetical protein